MKHDHKIDSVIEALYEGKTFRTISTELDIPLSSLHDMLSRDEHFARARVALEASAQEYADKAEQVLKDAKSNLVEIQRARELAQQYRWMAAKRNPRKFSEKLDVTSDGKELKTTIINLGSGIKPDEATS